MILCGETPIDSNGSEHAVTKTVHLLAPPANSTVGTRVFLKSFPESAASVPPTTVSGKVWDKVKPLLKVMNGFATYDGSELVTPFGTVTVPGCADGSSIL